MSRELEELKDKSEEAEKKYTACEFESIKKIGKLNIIFLYSIISLVDTR